MHTHTFNLEGLWGEISASSVGHCRTLASLYFDADRHMYCLDGTNYFDDGREHCFFKTIQSHLDLSTGQLFYLFSGCMAEDATQTYYGSAVLTLSLIQNAWTVQEGYFFPLTPDAQAIPHTMQRLDATLSVSEQLACLEA